MQVETSELPKPKVKKKSSWMNGFHILKPLDDLAKAQLETKLKTLNDFKKLKRR